MLPVPSCLLDAADAVLQPRRARDAPRAGRACRGRAGRARTPARRRRRCGWARSRTRPRCRAASRRRAAATARRRWPGSRRTADHRRPVLQRRAGPPRWRRRSSATGERGATIGSGASPWRPNIAMQQVGLLGLGRQPGRRPGALHVDDQQRELQADRQADRLGLEVEARARGAGHAEVPGERCAERDADAAAISSSACMVRTPKFLCCDSSWRMSDAGVIG